MKSMMSRRLFVRHDLYLGGVVANLSRAVLSVAAVISIIGCSGERGSISNEQHTPNGSTYLEGRPVQSAANSDSSDAQVERLVANLSEGSKLDDLQAWASKVLAGTIPSGRAGSEPIDPVPRFVRELDPQHQSTAEVHWEEDSEYVNVSWWSLFPTTGAPFVWGVIVGKTNQHYQTAFPGMVMRFKNLRPGVFAYSLTPNE